MLRRLPILITPLLVSAVLQAAGPAWESIRTPPGANFSLQYRIYPVDATWVVEFRNNSSQKIHFNYRFPSLQTKKEAAANGRIHLNALKGRGQVPLPAFESRAPASLVHLPIQVFNVRVAATDHGGSETEED